MKRSIKALGVCLLAGAAAVTVTGCGKVNKDYDVYFFNQKSEIADSLNALADEISKNRFLMQTRSYHNFSDLHLTVLLHQSNQPDIFLLCFLLFFLYFHDVLMHIRLLFSYLYPFYPLNKRIIPSFVSL